MKTNFLGQAYKSRVPILAASTAINIYAEGSEGNSDEVGSFIGTPGLVTKYTGSGSVRGLHNGSDGNLYAVIGASVLRINAAFVATNLGTLPNSLGIVSITDNGEQVAFAHALGWHWVAFGGTAIAPVTNSPPNSIITTQDQYVLFTESTGGEFGVSALADLSSIDPLDVATAEGEPDNLVSILSDHREAWLFGDEDTEIWTDTGAAFFPFERSPGGFIEMGCAASRSPTKIDNSVFWLGKDGNGKGIVYRANAYIPTRISTHAIEYAINQFSDISDAIGLSYQEEGHAFYWLIFPTGNTSFCYDVASGGWHQRVWLNTLDDSLNRPRANCYATFNNMHLVGDYANGKIYQMSLNIGTDDGSPIYRERAFDLAGDEDKRIRLDFVELMATTGDGDSTYTTGQPLVGLEISRDSGRTYGYKRLTAMGAIGETNARVRWRRLGMSRQTNIRISTSMAGRVQWTGVNVRGEALDK